MNHIIPEQPYQILDWQSMGSPSFGPGIPTPDIDLLPAASGGDLTFARQNYLLQSQTIATGAAVTAPWVINGAFVPAPTVLADQAVAPDGTTTADLINFAATRNVSDVSMVFQPFTATAVPWTASIWLRTASGTATVYIALTDGSLLAETTSVACAVTTTWTRFSVSRTLAANVRYFVIGPNTGLAYAQPAVQPAASVYVWGAQVSKTALPIPYIATTSAAVNTVLTKNGAPTTVGSLFFKRGAATTDRAVALNGTADYYSLGDVLDPITDLTILVIWKPTSNFGNRRLVAKGDTDDTFIFRSEAGGGATDVPMVFYAFKGVADYSAFGVGTATKDAWNVAAVSYQFVGDGSSIGKGNVNGIAAAGTAALKGPLRETAGVLSVGGKYVAAEFTQGSVARVCIFRNFAATQAQLAQMVASQTGLLALKPNTQLISHARSDATFVCPISDAEGYWVAPNVPAIKSSGIEVYGVANNLLKESQTIATGAGFTAPWFPAHLTSVNPTTLADQALSPSVLQTADLVNFDAINGANQASIIYQQFTGTAVPYTASVWARTVSGAGTLYLALEDESGLETFTACGCDTTWQRFSVTRTLTASASWYVTLGPDSRAFTGQPNDQPALSVYLWGAQATPTSIPMPYRATTNAQYLGAAGTATTLSAPFVQSDATTWTNKCLQSEGFASGTSIAAPWVIGHSGGTVTVSGNAAIAPDGSFSADLVNFPAVNNGGFGIIYQQFGAAFSGNHTISFYAKTVTGTGTLYATFWTAGRAHFYPVTVTNTWQRFTIPVPALANAVWYLIIGRDGRATLSDMPVPQTALSCYIWGVQVESGLVANPYVPTTTVATTGGLNGGVGKTVTNICLQSEAFSNASWVKTNTTVTPDTTIAPDGTLTADTIVVNSDGGARSVRQDFTATATRYSYSFYVKGSGGVTRIVCGIYQGAWPAQTVVVDGAGNAGGTGPVSVSGLSTSTWTRVTVTTNAALAAGAASIYIYPNDSATQFTGDSVIVWGVQIEAAPYAGAYVGPTLAAAVSRVNLFRAPQPWTVGVKAKLANWTAANSSLWGGGAYSGINSTQLLLHSNGNAYEIVTDPTVATWGSSAHSLTNQEATIIAEQRADSGAAMSVDGTPLSLAYSQGPVRPLSIAPTTLYLGHVSDGTLQINGTIAKVITSRTILGQHG